MTAVRELRSGDIPAEETMTVGKVKVKGIRIRDNQSVLLDGRRIDNMHGAFIGDMSGKTVLVFDPITSSLTVGDIVRLRSRYYTVIDIVPAGKNVNSTKYGRKGIDLRPSRKQTYIVACASDTLRVNASEVTAVVRDGEEMV